MSSKRLRKKYVTDRQTDYLYDLMMNPDKFDDRLRSKWDEEHEKKFPINKEPNLDSRIATERKSIRTVPEPDSDNEEELPSNSSTESKSDIDFDENSVTEASVSSVSHRSSRSPYKQKVDNDPIKPIPYYKPKTETKPIAPPPILADELVADTQKHIETPEEKRARSREMYYKLQDLVERHGIKLSRFYTIDDDPDIMEEEYKMHKERRNKNNKVKFYKNILLNIVSGVEFLNDKYDPFAFKLKDWSKQIASDMDDYTEVLEELYEKYKDRGGNFSPEVRLLFMILMSGVTYHLSQALFGSGGLNDTIKANPNVLGKLLGGFMKPGTNPEQEPMEARQPPPDSKNILAALQKHRQARSEPKTETES
jgi:hypothetical protein